MKKQFLLGLVAMALPLASWAADDVLKVTVTPTNSAETIVYAGDDTPSKFDVTVTFGDTELQAGQYTIFYTQTATGDNQVNVRNAGTYTAHAMITSSIEGLKIGDQAETEFTVDKLQVTSLAIENNEITKEYGTEDEDVDLSEFVTTSQLVADTDAEHADFIKCLKLVRKQGYEKLESVKDLIQVTLVANDDEDVESNYEYNPGNSVTVNVPLIITPKELTVERTEMTRKYNETPFGVSTTFALPYFELVDAIEEDDVEIEQMTYSGGASLTDAGEYALKATLKGKDKDNYTVKEIDADGNHVIFEIEKATLTVAKKTGVTDIEITYGDEDPDWFDIYTFTPSYAIAPATSPVAFAKAKAQTLVEVTRTEGDDADEDGYEITIALKTPAGVKNYVLAGYDESDVLVINPIKINTDQGSLIADITLAPAENIAELLTYKGKDFADASNIDLVKDLFTLTYGEDTELDYGTDYTISVDLTGYNNQEGKAIKAGHKFHIQVSGTGNYSGGCWVGGEYKIERANLTITAIDDESLFVKVENGEAVGDVTDLYTYTGLVGKDIDEEGNIVEGEVLKMWCNGKTPGTHDVHVIDVNDNDRDLTKGGKTDLVNYNITYDWTAQRITILDANGFVLDRSATEEGKTVADVCEKYNGLEVDVKMAARSFEANRWYTLVLPFDINVSEISKALGYAVVDTPVKSNTDQSVIAFGVHVGKVEANTLMLVKVEADPLTGEGLVDEDGNFTFGTREIKYVAEEVVTKDAAQNEYRGVYAPIKIEGDGYWYLTGGKFYNAGADGGKVGQVNINALGGYVYSPVARGNARILVEEADGTITAINAITGETIHNAAEGWYTIDGVKLNAQPTQKGVYINNGMKVVIK